MALVSLSLHLHFMSKIMNCQFQINSVKWDCTERRGIREQPFIKLSQTYVVTSAPMSCYAKFQINLFLTLEVELLVNSLL